MLLQWFEKVNENINFLHEFLFTLYEKKKIKESNTRKKMERKHKSIKTVRVSHIKVQRTWEINAKLSDQRLQRLKFHFRNNTFALKNNVFFEMCQWYSRAQQTQSTLIVEHQIIRLIFRKYAEQNNL